VAELVAVKFDCIGHVAAEDLSCFDGLPAGRLSAWATLPVITTVIAAWAVESPPTSKPAIPSFVQRTPMAHVAARSLFATGGGPVKARAPATSLWTETMCNRV
jgi:hypothetical protein